MSDVVFVDSNILVYAHDADAGPKRDRAVKSLRLLWESGAGRLSVQVLQEFYVVTTRKLKVPLSEERAARAVRGIATRPMGIHNGWREQRNSQATLTGWPPPPTR